MVTCKERIRHLENRIVLLYKKILHFIFKQMNLKKKRYTYRMQCAIIKICKIKN